MLRHSMGMYIVICDTEECNNILPGELSMDLLRKARRAAGWECRQTKTGWRDICPDCLHAEKYGAGKRESEDVAS